jgi:glycyl-tRNA synthetase beta chain
MKNDLLLELGCEDLPARYVQPLATALLQGVTDGLGKRGITTGPVRSFATPRRLAVLIAGVPAQQPAQTLERSGPALATALKDGKPTAAALGFAKSCGVEFSELAEKDGKLHFSKSSPGRATHELLAEIFEETLKQMDQLVPKRMRWGSGEETFVRPVQWIVALLGSKVVPISRFGLKSGNKTYGHRFHAPKAIILKSPAEYEKKLKAAKVWADFASRRAAIWKGIEAAARKLKGVPHANEALLDEVTALVEWPVVIHGRMEERFMALPPEVIIATIEHNQRYFPVFGPDQKLLPAFIAVSNIESRDATQVIVGNERVVRPRLSDALFFWDQDRKKPLSANNEALAKLTFQQKLGTVADKTRRIVAISSKIAETLNVEAKTVARAAELCKADLVTRMVYEFPELQGIMGGYYAKSSGETESVAHAIREHYQPIQSGGPIPESIAGRIVALADKLDTLAGIFAIGQKPTASKDPFALRRAALGVLRILIEGGLALNLRPWLFAAVNAQPGHGKDPDADRKLGDDILEFVMERLRGYYVERSVPVEVFEAVLATGEDNLLDFDRRISAVHAFLKLPQAQQLSAAHKRIRNILRQAGKRYVGPAPDPLLFNSEAEKILYKEMCGVESELTSRDKNGQYTEALARLAQLQSPVDRFFEDVMVMDENPDIRENRLKLLARLDEHCRSIADISCLPG